MQGPGSLIRLDLFVTTPPCNLTNGKFIAYSTFDQGSSKSEFSFVDYEEPKSFIDQFNDFVNIYLSSTSIIGVILTIFTAVISVISVMILSIKFHFEKNRIRKKSYRVDEK